MFINFLWCVATSHHRNVIGRDLRKCGEEHQKFISIMNTIMNACHPLSEWSIPTWTIELPDFQDHTWTHVPLLCYHLCVLDWWLDREISLVPMRRGGQSQHFVRWNILAFPWNPPPPKPIVNDMALTRQGFMKMKYVRRHNRSIQMLFPTVISLRPRSKFVTRPESAYARTLVNL